MILDESNFSLYAAKYYDNPNCTDILEFHDDLNRIKYIKRLFKFYAETGEIKSEFEDFTEYFSSNEFTFKVIK